MNLIKKTASTVTLGIQSVMVYRGNFLISLFTGVISLFSNMIFWPAVYGVDIFNQSKIVSGNIAGYSLIEMISYALLVYVLQWGITATSTGYSIKMDILTGKINYYLLKPYDYLGIRVIFSITQQLLSFVVSIAIFTILMRNMQLWVIIPSVSSFLMVVVAIILSYIISFQLSCLIGMISFWILETSSLNVLIKGITLILSGAIFPLDFIEGTFGKLLIFLPFNYLIFFPTQLYLNKLSDAEVMQGYLSAVLWIITLGFLIKLLWNKGIRRYSSFGG